MGIPIQDKFVFKLEKTGDWLNFVTKVLSEG
jgi:hypothetical protein